MANRDRVTEIIEIKRRGQRHATSLHYDLRSLWDRWQVFPMRGDVSAGFFPIRAVTLMEVFTRAWIGTLVDHGPPYVERAVSLAKNFKIDYELLREVQGRTITLGDIVSHSLSLNNLGQVIGVFEALIAEGFVPRIARAADRWKAEILGEPPVAIIADVDIMCTSIERLFEIRHVLVHEYPRGRVCRPEEISPMLQAAADFAAATDEYCTDLLYGRPPLDNAGMKITAANELKESEAELSGVFARVVAESDDEGKKLFDNAQQKWLEYRNRESDVRANLARGGTLAGLLWLREAKELTQMRSRQLRWYLERKEGEV